MKMRPIPLPQIIPQSPSAGPSYRSDRVAAQQLAKAERRRKRKDGDEEERGSRKREDGDEPGPGSRFDGMA